MKGREYTLSENLTKKDVAYLFDNYNEIKTNIELIESALRYVTSQAYVDGYQYASGVKVGSGGSPTIGTISDKTFNTVANADSACRREQEKLQQQLRTLCFVKEQIDIYVKNLNGIHEVIFKERYINKSPEDDILTAILEKKSHRVSRDAMYVARRKIVSKFMSATLIKKQDVMRLAKILDNN